MYRRLQRASSVFCCCKFRPYLRVNGSHTCTISPWIGKGNPLKTHWKILKIFRNLNFFDFRWFYFFCNWNFWASFFRLISTSILSIYGKIMRPEPLTVKRHWKNFSSPLSPKPKSPSSYGNDPLPRWNTGCPWKTFGVLQVLVSRSFIVLPPFDSNQ